MAPQSLATQLTSFFQAMYNRMVGRASKNNPVGSGHIGSTPQDITGAGRSGNLGGGAIPIGSIAVYPDPNTEGYVKNGYSGNGTIYTIISHAARKFAYIPRYVYQIKDPQAVRNYKDLLSRIDSKKPGQRAKVLEYFTKAYDETVVYNALSELMERPNPGEGQDSFFEKAYIYYKSAGEAVIWCNRGTDAEDLPKIDGPILEMYVLPPQYMEMVPDPLNVWGSLGWIFNVAGKRIPIDNENIIHVKMPNPNFDGVTRQHMRGMSPLRPGNKKLTEDESATDASVALNQNEGAKGIAFDKTPGVLKPEKETAMRNAVDRKVNNRDMKGAVAWLQGDLGYLDLSMSSVDMELEDRKSNIFDRLCNLIGVPPDIFKTGQTYQNLVQARKDLITNLSLPDACKFRDEFNRVLLPAFNLNKQKYTTDVDITSIPELQDDMTSQTTALMAAWHLTPNQRLKEQNFEESTAEGMDDVWVPNNLVRMEDAISAGAMGGFDPSTGEPITPANDPSQDPSNDDDQPAANPKKKANAAGGKNKGGS